VRTASLDSALDLVKVVSEVTERIAGVVDDVPPQKLTHRELGFPLEGALTNIALRNETTECALGDKEANLIQRGFPCWIGEVLVAVVRSCLNERLDQNREARAIDRVEAEGLLVDSQLDAAIRIINEGVFLESITNALVVTRNEGKKLLLETGLIAQALGLIRRADEHKMLACTVTEELGGEVVAHVVGQRHKELVGNGSGRNAALEVDCNLVVTTAQHLAKLGCIRVKNSLYAGLNKELVAVVRRHQRLDTVLKVLASYVKGLNNGVTSLLNADGWTLAAHVLKAGRELGLTKFSRLAGNAARADRHVEYGLNKALVGNYTASNEGFDGVTRIGLRGSAVEYIGVRIVQSNESDDFIAENWILGCDPRIVICRIERAG